MFNSTGGSLTGNFPPEFGTLENMVNVTVAFNGLAGPLPVELFNLVGLKQLILSGNNFTGDVPTEIIQLESIKKLRVDSNALTGVFPPITNSPDLTYFNASCNYFTSVPSSNYNEDAALRTLVVIPQYNEKELTAGSLGLGVITLAFGLLAIMIVVGLFRKRNRKE